MEKILEVATCALVPYLKDADVDGHVVDASLKMKEPGFADRVAPLTRADKAWIRGLARKYLERYPVSSEPITRAT